MGANGQVDGRGGKGRWAQFIVHTLPSGHVRLQNVGNPAHHLRNLKNDTVDGRGGTGAWTELEALENPNGTISLRSISFGTFLGVLPNGNTKQPSKTGRGLHGQFFIVPLSAPLTGKFAGKQRHAVRARHAITASAGGRVTLSSSSDSSSSSDADGKDDAFALFGLSASASGPSLEVKQNRVQRGKPAKPMMRGHVKVGGAGVSAAWWL